ncbi:MAG: penicillin-binding protein [Candidatus Cloacimonetes bacterium]|nr:penicillin-binding protein [Candidatus Cloacimonadota bacterium]
MRDLKHLCTPTRTKNRRGLVLVSLLALILIPLALLLVRQVADAYSSWRGQPPAPAPISLGTELFGTANALLPAAQQTDNGLIATANDGTLLHYSIMPALQQRVERFLRSYQVPYGLLIALEPSTGRVLALAGHSSLAPDWTQQAPYQLYPMASLFKMVTAAAALENGVINPDTVLAFRGSAISETPSSWDPRPRGRNNQMDVSDAMGKSCNPVYGRIASDLVGAERLQAACEQFGFNRQLLPGLPVHASQAPLAATTTDLRLLGSGLEHNLQISPLHAALITAGIANKGVMMTPRLVDRAEREQQELRLAPTTELLRVTSPQVADSLTRMLTSTVTTGTSRRAFRSPQARQLLASVSVAAKTGSINGDNPKGHYSWFAAYAPADDPQIALVALVINGNRWKIKASQVGEQALDAFFRAGS